MNSKHSSNVMEKVTTKVGNIFKDLMRKYPNHGMSKGNQQSISILYNHQRPNQQILGRFFSKWVHN